MNKYWYLIMGIPSGSYGKESTCNADVSLIPGEGRSPGEGNGISLQQSESSAGELAWRVPWTEEPGGGHKELNMIWPTLSFKLFLFRLPSMAPHDMESSGLFNFPCPWQFLRLFFSQWPWQEKVTRWSPHFRRGIVAPPPWWMAECAYQLFKILLHKRFLSIYLF